MTFPRLGSAVLVRAGTGWSGGNRVLLGRRAKEPNYGKWIIPGGKVEPFESIAEAGKREILEETGLAIEIEEQIGVFEIIVPNEEHRVIVYSWGRIIGGNVEAASDLSEIRFVDKLELPWLETTPIVKQVFKRIEWLGE